MVQKNPKFNIYIFYLTLVTSKNDENHKQSLQLNLALVRRVQSTNEK